MEPGVDDGRPRVSKKTGITGLDVFFFAAQATFGIQPASARSHYGILNSQAPALDLDTWIDSRGKKMAPIHLSAYRGKVIYLYFFQDW